MWGLPVEGLVQNRARTVTHSISIPILKKRYPFCFPFIENGTSFILACLQTLYEGVTEHQNDEIFEQQWWQNVETANPKRRNYNINRAHILTNHDCKLEKDQQDHDQKSP